MAKKQPTHHSKKQARQGGRFVKVAKPQDDGRLPIDLKLPKGAPMQELGVGGSKVWGGYVVEDELNSALQGRTKYKTFSDLIANVNIIAASVRMFLGMVSGAEWKVEPSDPEDQASVDMAEEVDELLFEKMETNWHRVVRRLAMYKFYGFSVSEWTAKKMDDGRIGMKSIRPRPQITIERWFLDPHGEVLGVAQTDPQTGREYALPRAKLVYLVDDAISDDPMGLGLFRHVAESATRLRRYLQLEGYGYEADMRGIPVGRAPLAELDNLVKSKQMSKQKAQELLDGMSTFLSEHIKNPGLGLMVDSTPYRNTGEQRNVSPSPQWDVSLLDGGTYGSEHLHEAIVRTQREIARVFGTEFMMLGENSSGSRSLSNDKTSLFGMIVDDALTTIRDQMEDDVLVPLFELNGWEQDLKPTLKFDTQVFRDPAELTAALRDLAQGGVQFDRQDESVQEILDLLGLSRFVKLEEIDPDLVLSAGQAQEQAMELMGAEAELNEAGAESENGREEGRRDSQAQRDDDAAERGQEREFRSRDDMDAREKAKGEDEKEAPDREEARKRAPERTELETLGAFIERFMTDDRMIRDYPDWKDRLRVARDKGEQ